MATISQADVNIWHIPLAPLAEQRRIVVKIEHCSRRRTPSSARSSRRVGGRKVDQAILARAFRGEL